MQYLVSTQWLFILSITILLVLCFHSLRWILHSYWLCIFIWLLKLRWLFRFSHRWLLNWLIWLIDMNLFWYIINFSLIKNTNVWIILIDIVLISWVAFEHWRMYFIRSLIILLLHLVFNVFLRGHNIGRKSCVRISWFRIVVVINVLILFLGLITNCLLMSLCFQHHSFKRYNLFSNIWYPLALAWSYRRMFCRHYAIVVHKNTLSIFDRPIVCWNVRFVMTFVETFCWCFKLIKLFASNIRGHHLTFL